MKSIEIDEALYQYLASKAVANGEPVSAILRRELKLPAPLISVEIERTCTATLLQRPSNSENRYLRFSVESSVLTKENTMIQR